MDLYKVKAITIPEGAVTKIVSAGVTLWQTITETYKNWVKYSTEADGVTIYNGGLGCMYGYRLNSSGDVKEMSGGNHTGYIPMTYGDVIRAKGSSASSAGAGGNYFSIYDASFARLDTFTMSNTTAASFYSATYTQQDDGLYMLTLDTGKAGYNALSTQNAAYFRISFADCETNDFIVTVNEEIA